jgi:LysM repeat protein
MTTFQMNYKSVKELLRQNNNDFQKVQQILESTATTSVTHNAGKTQTAGNKTKYIMTVGNVTHVRTTAHLYTHAVVVEFFKTSFVICSKTPITVERVKREKYQGLHRITQNQSSAERAAFRRENAQKVDQWMQSGDLKMHFFTFNK